MVEIKKLSKEEEAEMNLASYWNMKFKESMVTKAPYTKRWTTYWDAYRGDYFKNTNLPDYKSNLVSNYIFSIIETIRPIMFDNDPKYQAIPRQPEGLDYSNDWQEVLTYEWDRENMGIKTIREAITLLVTGSAVYFVPWDKESRNIKAIPVSPDNIFPDPLATCVEDAGYIIYAKYTHNNLLKKQFPHKAHRFVGASVNYSELVNQNDRNAQVDDQVLVLEIHAKDYESLMTTETGTALKYPKGRVLVLCPELGVVLEDKENPYEDGKFPFVLMKDYDVPGKFWGEGEVAQLISPQQYMNELNNAILDNAKTTANMPWIVDKNAGIGEGKITSRPGLVIRKNPGTEVRREQAPNMPNYVVGAVEQYKHDMEQVSGIFDSIKGNSETGVYTAQGILALQEAGQARIRLKVKLYESALTQLAKMWVSRIKQFWKEDRYIGITRFDGSYDIKAFTNDAKKFEYDVKITAGSTMPVNRGAMLDLMIRLAQTPMPDGQNLVDREAVVSYLPEEAKSTILRRMNGKKEELTVQVEQLTARMDANEQADQQEMSTLEQMTSVIEKLKAEILQLTEKHDKVEKEKAEQEKLTKATDDGYNRGYEEAEKLASPMEGANPMDDVQDEEGLDGQLPDDILQGLEDMSDDELAVLLESNPELADLIK